MVRKEFKEHVGEIENLRNVARDRHVKNSCGWETFEEDDENCHPNLFTNQDRSSSSQQQKLFPPLKEDRHTYFNFKSSTNYFENNLSYDHSEPHFF